ncbi:MAG: molecular chaperone DnaK, partial [Lysobacterales bacterium]
DKGTGTEQSIRITAPTKLSDEEIDNLVKEAEKYAADDKKKKEEVEAVNQANALVYSTEKSLKDYGDKITEDEKKAIEVELENLKKAIEAKDLEKINASQEALQKAAHKLAEEVYKATEAEQKDAGAGDPAAAAAGAQEASSATAEGSTDAASDSKKDEDVIDADFKAE